MTTDATLAVRSTVSDARPVTFPVVAATVGAELLQANDTPGTTAPLTSCASATNCCVAPTDVSVALAGETMMDVTLAERSTDRLAPPVTPCAVAVIVVAP